MNAATETETPTADPAAVAQGGDHGHGDAKPSYDDINVPVVLLVGLISMVLTFITIWFVEGVYYHWNRSQVQQQFYDVTNTRQNELLRKQQVVLNDGDEERGIVSVDNAIPNVLARFGSSEDPSQDDGEGQLNEEEAGH